jgi:uncharacterized protein (TIGR03067 family)
MSMGGMLLLTLLAVRAVHADDAKNADVRKQLLGTWQLTQGVVGGSPLPEQVVKNIRLELTDGKYRVTGAESPDEGTWNLHLDQKPFGLDVIGTDGPNKGKTFLAIFELDGDKLKVCYDLSGQARPTQFESKKQTLLFLAEYQRVKQ